MKGDRFRKGKKTGFETFSTIERLFNILIGSESVPRLEVDIFSREREN